MKRFVGLLLVTLIADAAIAQDDPIVRVDVSPETVTVGESVEVEITILVPTWFPRPPVYPDFELSNAITRLPPNSSYPTSERIGRATWSGIVRRYRVYPLVGATYRIADEMIGVTWANPGGDPLAASVPVPEIVFRGTVPAGAEQLDPYIAGSSLDIDLDVADGVSQLEAGDAVVLTWTATLEGLPAIFIPPIAPTLEFDGVSVYADQPVVGDGPPATRTEKLTVVFEAGGDFAVPPVSLEYWNTQTGSVESAMLPGKTFRVAGPPPAVSGKTVAAASTDWWRIGILAAIAAVLLAAALQRVPVLRERSRQAAIAGRAAEPWAFEQLGKVLVAGDADQAYAALLAWAERLRPPMTSREFADLYGDADLRWQIENLGRQQFADGAPVYLDSLRTALEAARARYLSQQKRPTGNALPPLNPA